MRAASPSSVAQLDAAERDRALVVEERSSTAASVDLPAPLGPTTRHSAAWRKVEVDAVAAPHASP